MSSDTFNLVVLISGQGSNLQALIDAIKLGNIKAKISAVISNKETAYGLQRAQQAGIATHILTNDNHSSRQDFDKALGDIIEAYHADLIVLAGFMRILGADFVARFKDQIINIHPSLLPLYPGLNTHEQVLKDKQATHGCTIHFVTNDLDSGPIIAQAVRRLCPTESLSGLQQKVHEAEHFLYPTVVKWFSEQRLAVANGDVALDGVKLPRHGLKFELTTQ